MPFISLLSDHGLKDYYIAAVKAHLFSRIEGLQIIDISHDVEKFNVSEAAYQLKNCYREFPKGTLHLIGVENDVKINKFIIIKTIDYHFLAIDNGLLSLVIPENEIVDIVELTYKPIDLLFPLKKILSQAACDIFNGRPLRELGAPLNKISPKLPLPLGEDGQGIIEGRIIHVDSFGNCITNITKKMLEDFGRYTELGIIFNHTDVISELKSNYVDVVPGEILALFNTQGNLELSMNKGSFSKLMGLKFADKVMMKLLAPK